MAPKQVSLCKRDTRSFQEKHFLLIYSLSFLLVIAIVFIVAFLLGEQSVYSSGLV